MPHSNSGEELRELLMGMYPAGTSSFLQKIDSDLMSDGTLAALFYQSCLNYLVRRLITQAEHFRRSFPSEWKLKLRAYLRNHTRYRDGRVDELVQLLRIPTQNDRDSEMKPAGIPKFPAAIPISNRPLF